MNYKRVIFIVLVFVLFFTLIYVITKEIKTNYETKIHHYETKIYHYETINDSLRYELKRYDVIIKKHESTIDSLIGSKQIINNYYETRINNVLDGTISNDSVTNYIRSRIYRY